MTVRYIKEDKLLIMELQEEIDHHISEKIRRRADYEIQRYMPKKAIFDFSSVTFMDSAGIGLIIGRYKLLSLIGAKLEIINVTPTVERILEISGIRKLIPGIGEKNEKYLW